MDLSSILLSEKEECDRFQVQYEKFITNMDSKKFAEIVIMNGHTYAIKIFIEQMKEQNYKIPIIIQDELDSYNEHHLKKYFELNDVSMLEGLTEQEMIHKYYEFKNWMRFNYYSQTICPSFNEFKHWIEYKNIGLKRLENLDILDCELMKSAHLN
jgi:hypothetical protein